MLSAVMSESLSPSITDFGSCGCALSDRAERLSLRSTLVGHRCLQNPLKGRFEHRLRNVGPPSAYLSHSGNTAIAGVSTLDSDDVGEFCHGDGVTRRPLR